MVIAETSHMPSASDVTYVCVRACMRARDSELRSYSGSSSLSQPPLWLPKLALHAPMIALQGCEGALGAIKIDAGVFVKVDNCPKSVSLPAAMVKVAGAPPDEAIFVRMASTDSTLVQICGEQWHAGVTPLGGNPFFKM